MLRQINCNGRTYHPPKPNPPPYKDDPPTTPVVCGPSCVEINGAFFHSTFYTQLPPPPLGPLDPCFKPWAESTFFAYMLQIMSYARPQHSSLCTAIREQYFAASRDYANALEKWWGWFLPNQVKYLWKVDGPIPYFYHPATTSIS